MKRRLRSPRRPLLLAGRSGKGPARIIATSTDVNPNYDLSSENKEVILEFMIVQVWELQ